MKWGPLPRMSAGPPQPPAMQLLTIHAVPVLMQSQSATPAPVATASAGPVSPSPPARCSCCATAPASAATAARRPARPTAARQSPRAPGPSRTKSAMRSRCVQHTLPLCLPASLPGGAGHLAPTAGAVCSDGQSGLTWWNNSCCLRVILGTPDPEIQGGHPTLVVGPCWIRPDVGFESHRLELHVVRYDHRHGLPCGRTCDGCVGQL